MKKTSIWLIVAGALVLIGILLFVGAMAVNHWSFSGLGGAKLVTNTYPVSEAFENILIQTNVEDIVFVPADDGACKVICLEERDTPHTVKVVDGTLTIGVEKQKSWTEHFSLGGESPKITVCLPKAEYASLQIEESTGGIELPSDFTFGTVTIDANTGDVTCGASVRERMQIQLSTGAICLNSISAGELGLTTSTGRIELRSVACAGNLDLSVSTGKTVLSDVTCANLSSNGSTGEITLERVVAAGQISIGRSTGDVKFTQCDADELFVETDTGDVTGSLLSEKVFITKSDTGRVEVPETTSGGKCKITTDTGNIVITIG